MQHRDEQRRDRLVEVDQPRHLGMTESPLRVTDVRLDDGGVLVLLQQRPPVREHDGVVVDVDHVGVRIDALRDLVHIVLRGQP